MNPVMNSLYEFSLVVWYTVAVAALFGLATLAVLIFLETIFIRRKK